MSRFVAAGGAEAGDIAKDAAREDAWAKAQQQIEAIRAKPKPQAGKQEDGKSLYEVLEANKAAKQADFEEQAKLKNQFRALDDDELDFLDSVLTREKAKEIAVRKETAEELASFRKLQQEAERGVSTDVITTSDAPTADPWRAKKRRRKDADIPLSKVRKTSDLKSPSPPPAAAPVISDVKGISPPVKEAAAKGPSISALGLAYDSSDDDD